MGGLDMKDIKDILVPVDFSLCSRNAVASAIEVAKRYDARLHILHVYETSPVVAGDVMIDIGGGGSTTLREFVRDQTRSMFDEFIASVDGLDEVEWTEHLVSGTPSQVALHKAEQGPCDLLVMGTHGRRGISHFLLGSVAERVIRQAPCPVLVVRSEA